VSLDDGERTLLVEEESDHGVLLHGPESMALSDDGLTMWIADRGTDSVVAVSLVDGVRTLLSGLLQPPGVLVENVRALLLRGDHVVAFDDLLEGVVDISLADGTRTVWSDVGLGGGPTLRSSEDARRVTPKRLPRRYEQEVLPRTSAQPVGDELLTTAVLC
jgi:sugar lactone lactonase YvrE